MINFISESFHLSYKHLLKPIFFQFDAETVHNTIVSVGAVMAKIPGLTGLISWLFAEKSPKLGIQKDGIAFPNPVGLSAGFDYNGNLTGILPAVGFGFHTIGTITFHPYEGNPSPRLGRFPKSQGLLVNKGLKNIGTPAAIAKLSQIDFQIPTGISIGYTNQPYPGIREQVLDVLQSFRLFEQSSVKHAYYELNISCPNTFGGEPFSVPNHLQILLAALDKMEISRPVYVKFPIDQTWEESKVLLDIIANHSPAGVIIGNLTKDKTNPAVEESERSIWQNSRGNVSGKPTWERSNALIQNTRRHYGDRFTIIGTGGIFSGEDARTKLDLGADLVQLITGMIFEGPTLIGQINHHLVK